MTLVKKWIENLDEDLWNKFTGLAKMRDVKVGKLLNEILFTFLEKQKVIDQQKEEKGEGSA